MKHRLNHEPLAPPKVTFADHDPVSEQKSHPIDSNSLGAVAVVGYQDAHQPIGLADDVSIRFLARSVDTKDIAVQLKVNDHLIERIVRIADIKSFYRPWR